MTLLESTLDAVVVERPLPSEDAPQHLCLDKGYDNRTGEQATLEAGYIPHIRRIGEEKNDTAGEKTHPARRWVVERTLAWLSRLRGLLVRYDKLAECYLAMVKLGCALLWFRRFHDLTHEARLLTEILKIYSKSERMEIRRNKFLRWGRTSRRPSFGREKSLRRETTLVLTALLTEILSESPTIKTFEMWECPRKNFGLPSP